MGQTFYEVQIVRVHVLAKQATGNDTVWTVSNSQVILKFGSNRRPFSSVESWIEKKFQLIYENVTSNVFYLLIHQSHAMLDAGV